MDEHNSPVLLDVVGNNFAKIAKQFAVAQHSLTTTQLKAWIVFVATLDADHDDGNNIYQFNAIELAKSISIDERKARGTIVAKIFKDLSHRSIEYISDEDDSGEQNIFSTNFVSSVLYSRSTHMLQLEIPKLMRPFLFALKQGTFMRLNTRHIAALNTTAAIRIYIYLKNLERLGIFCDDIASFKRGIGITSAYYDSYKQLKAKIIKPAVKEIRMHTDYKDFFIEDDGRPGVKATRIRFGFEKTIDNDIFEGIPANRAAVCRKFPEELQVVMRLAMDYGFDPLYIADKLEEIPAERILANFRYVMVEVIGKDKKRGLDKGADVYGKYFLTAVREGWAEKNGKEDEMLLRQENHVQNRKLQEQMKIAQERDDVVHEAVRNDDAAKRYLEKLFADKFELERFIDENSATLSKMAGKNPFDKGKALTGKKTYREYKLMVRLISSKILINEIEIPTQENLFSC